MAVQRLSTWCALLCRDPAFQQFLGVEGEVAAADKVRALCGVASRAEFDRDLEAVERLHQIIRKPYQQYLQDPQNQTTQEK